MNKLFLMLFCFLSRTVYAYDNSANLTLEKLVDICAEQERSLTNLTVEYTFAISGPNVEKIDKGDFRWVGPQTNLFIAKKPFSKRFMIIQEQQFEDGHKRIIDSCYWKAYNGLAYREFQVSSQNDTAVGLITKEPPSDVNMNYTPLGFTLFHQWWDRSLLDVLKDQDPNLTFSLNPVITKVNDCDSIELTCSMKNPLSGKLMTLMSIFFSINHHYAIVRIAYWNGSRIVLEYNVREFRSVGEGLWFPIHGDIKNSEGDINEIWVADVQINQAFEESEFELEFPPGTKVNDTISGKHYTIKPTQEQLDQILDGN